MSYMTYAMGRMTYIWGKDAEEFWPERWLRNGIFRSESPFKFTAFHVSHILCFPSKIDMVIVIFSLVLYVLINFFFLARYQAGPRMCLGKEFAYRQMKISAAVLLNLWMRKGKQLIEPCSLFKWIKASVYMHCLGCDKTKRTCFSMVDCNIYSLTSK